MTSDRHLRQLVTWGMTVWYKWKGLYQSINSSWYFDSPYILLSIASWETYVKTLNQDTQAYARLPALLTKYNNAFTLLPMLTASWSSRQYQVFGHSYENHNLKSVRKGETVFFLFLRAVTIHNSPWQRTVASSFFFLNYSNLFHLLPNITWETQTKQLLPSRPNLIHPTTTNGAHSIRCIRPLHISYIFCTQEIIDVAQFNPDH